MLCATPFALPSWLMWVRLGETLRVPSCGKGWGRSTLRTHTFPLATLGLGTRASTLAHTLTHTSRTHAHTGGAHAPHTHTKDEGRSCVSWAPCQGGGRRPWRRRGRLIGGSGSEGRPEVPDPPESTPGRSCSWVLGAPWVLGDPWEFLRGSSKKNGSDVLC